MIKNPISFLAFILCFSMSEFNAQNAFEFYGDKISPGEQKHFTIELSDGKSEAIIPITVFHGIKDGPTLGITAGVHGYEYAPILAGQELIDKIQAENLVGTIILVQIANVSSFLGRSPFTNPSDGKNLNRVFPGSSEGSITERIADFLSKEVIGRSDYFLDVHSGDGPEDLMAYTAYYQNDGAKDISDFGRKMASHMGFDHVIVFKTTGKAYLEADKMSLYCSAEAFKQGKPAIDIECGRLGMVEPILVDKITQGIISLLRFLKMESGKEIFTESIQYIDERSSISSKSTGFFYPQKVAGDYVRKGMVIGYTTNFFGERLETIKADIDGLVLYILGTPPISKGETVVSLGKIK